MCHDVQWAGVPPPSPFLQSQSRHTVNAILLKRGFVRPRGTPTRQTGSTLSSGHSPVSQTRCELRVGRHPRRKGHLSRTFVSNCDRVVLLILGCILGDFRNFKTQPIAFEPMEGFGKRRIHLLRETAGNKRPHCASSTTLMQHLSSAQQLLLPLAACPLFSIYLFFLYTLAS